MNPATTVRSSGTGKSVQGWSAPKTTSSPWYSSPNSLLKWRHLGQYGGCGRISSASQVWKYAWQAASLTSWFPGTTDVLVPRDD
ncbi:hypothetical protein [Streptomyces sp. SPB074]|uniref:hypothetical protein n=1 Tax=Streptomyces sp. (strain SPB074) TaxID=465543 RepID=UPI001F26FC19|nr:hypothetical protein [Streptomyces sp. SPB074]